MGTQTGTDETQTGNDETETIPRDIWRGESRGESSSTGQQSSSTPPADEHPDSGDGVRQRAKKEES